MHNDQASFSTSNKFKTCSVVGARGYSGLETARLLLQHPRAQLTHCFATSEFNLSNSLSNPAAAKVQCLPDSKIMDHLTDVVFLATPAEVSLGLAPQILARGKTVIDLSGAFRLKKNDYKKWYGFEHTENTWLTKAEYGLSSWIGPVSRSLSGNSPSEKLIANPGCYATAILLALIPLLKNNLILENSIVIDAKSGTSGAGKKFSENLLYTEVAGECLPYKVGKHQHYPEIIEALESFSSKNIKAHMTTSLLPIRRGIIANIYAQLAEGVTADNIEAAFETAYAENVLIEFGSLQKKPELLSLKKVVGTARTHISYSIEENRLYVFSCLDNLLKGAASQAIENFNRISDLPIFTGLTHLEAMI